MIGAFLARGIVGASPLLSTIAAATIMIATNRILAWLSIKSPLLNKLFKGSALILYGKINWKTWKKPA
jgi:Predicted membrane protein